MSFKFENKNVITLNCGNGHIVGYSSKLSEKMNNQDYMLDIWYFPKGYGVSHFIVGVSIENDNIETIQEEIVGLIESGYIIDSIENINRNIEEYERIDIFPSAKREEISFD